MAPPTGGENRVRPSGTNPRLIRRALQGLQHQENIRDAYNIPYDDSKSIGTYLDEMQAEIDAIDVRVKALEDA